MKSILAGAVGAILALSIQAAANVMIRDHFFTTGHLAVLTSTGGRGSVYLKESVNSKAFSMLTSDSLQFTDSKGNIVMMIDGKSKAIAFFDSKGNVEKVLK